MRSDPRWFADTNIVFHVLRGTPLGRHLVSALQFRARASTPLISVVTQAELYSLALSNDHGETKRARLEEVLNELVIVDINSRPIIDRYAVIDVASHRLGRSMGKNDLWIAASAIETDSVLLTTDHDFDHLSPTHLRLWWLNPDATSWSSAPP